MATTITAPITITPVAITAPITLGYAGATGPQGPQGATGATGVTGATGPAGSDASVTNTNVNAAISTDALATRTALGQARIARLANDATTGTTPVDVTGMTFSLAASTWYRLEIAFRYTSAATAGFNINLMTTGTFQTVELFNGAYGPASSNSSISNAFPSTTTRIFLRGANTAARTNAIGFATAYFKTNASGTGKIAIARDGAGSEVTSHEIVAVLSPF